MRLEDGLAQRAHNPREGAAELVCDSERIAADPSLAAQYVRALAEHGPQALITNAASQPYVMTYGEHSFPITLEDGEFGHTYVTSPHSAYVLYARDEIDIIGMRAGRTAAKGVLGVLDALLRSLRLNRTVHLDNWLLSTNLHGEWQGEGLHEMRKVLTDRFPDRFVILRSLDAWSCPALLEAARRDGWVLLPSRQIWVTDDLRRDWKKRNNTQNDRRALKKSGFSVDEPESLTLAEAERIAQLYYQLYVGRYSAINPIFTPRFIETAARIGLLHFRLVRAVDGTILAASGMRSAGGIATVPLLGYDLGRPQTEGLYRIASYLATDWAMERGLRFNGSAGCWQVQGHARRARADRIYGALRRTPASRATHWAELSGKSVERIDGPHA